MRIPKKIQISLISILIIVWILLIFVLLDTLGYKINIQKSGITILSPKTHVDTSQQNIFNSTSDQNTETTTTPHSQQPVSNTSTQTPIANTTRQWANKVSITRNIEYYTISGSTLYDIVESLNSNGPKGYSPNADAVVSAHAATEPTFVPMIDCNGNYEVDLAITYTYPKWNRPPNATNEAINAFNQYLVNLEKHERGHEDLAVWAADDIVKMIKNVDTSLPCEQQRRIVEVKAAEIVDKHYLKQYEYDRVTQHGATQGAYLYY